MAMDLNTDGHVDVEEYRREVKELFEPLLTPTEVEYSFKGFDADGDNQLSATEFMGVLRIGHFFQTPEALQKAAGASHAPTAPGDAPITEAAFVEHMQVGFPSPQAAFASMDKDGDSALNFDDFIIGVRSFTRPLDDKEAMYAFKGFDTDNDHTITQEEFFGTLGLGHFFQRPVAVQSAVEAMRLPNNFRQDVQEQHQQAPQLRTPKDQGTDDQFDCNKDLQFWELEWSMEKQGWCCAHEQKGCDTGQFADGASAPLAPATGIPLQMRVWNATQEPMTLRVFIKRLQASHNSPQAAYAALDRHSTGAVKVNDFAAAALAFSEPLTREESYYAFAGFDVTGDGVVTRAEFFGVLKVGHFYPSKQEFEAEAMSVPIAEDHDERDHGDDSDDNDPDHEHKHQRDDVLVDRRGDPSSRSEEAVPPIDAQDFAKRMGATVPAALLGILAPSGGCVDIQAFRAAAVAFSPPLTGKEVDYAFRGMDLDHDAKVCSAEYFGVLKSGSFGRVPVADPAPKVDIPSGTTSGKSTPSPSSVAPPSSTTVSTTAQLTQASTSLHPTTTPKKDSTSALVHATTAASKEFVIPGDAVPGTKLEMYRGVPAIVNGHAEVALNLRPDAGKLDKSQLNGVGEAFARALQHAAGVDVTVAAVESFHEVSKGTKATILWTAGASTDGGSLQIALRDESADLERSVEQAIFQQSRAWLQSCTVWAKVSLSYYGPNAADLPFGRKLTQEIGRRQGFTSANGSPAYAV